MDNLVGQVLGGRYEILEKIGGGGMAVVYKARCKLLNRFVAIKVLRNDIEMSDDFIKRFKVEAQAAGSLSHPNIVSIYDVGNEGDINYIVMEYVEGYTLKDVITKSDRLTWRAAVKFATQICAGLEHAHKNHIIHRDIKSQNILVNSDLTAKITDFGIARAASNSTITLAGSTIGSVHYFSPEQAKGQHTDEKSDIYSLGVVMYEMLTGRVPFDADTPVSVALKQIQELPIPPVQIDSEIPTAVSDIVLKALQKEPRLRYQSATEMLKDLYAVLENPNNIVISEANMGATTVMNSVNENMINERVNKPVVVEGGEKVRKKKRRRASGLVNLIAVLVSLFITMLVVFGLVYFLVTGVANNSAKKEVEMPNLTGGTYQEAIATLTDMNLLVKQIEYKESDTVAKNYVMYQYPQYGIKVKENVKIVELIISSGISEVTVPNVVQYTLAEAKTKLDSHELRYTVTEESSESIPVGCVVRQVPVANMKVEVGQVIELYVSSGPATIMTTVPNLVEKTVAEANKLLEVANLSAGEVTYDTNNSKSNGIILSQKIVAGTSVEEGTQIGYVVNKVTQTATPTPTPTPSKVTLPIYIALANKGVAGSPFEVRVEISGGGYVGKQVIYKNTHTREDEEILVNVSGNGRAMLEIYINGVRDSAQEIKFN
ncbi:MAG: Stk1 family PASTA domain-containing Ser/Thr kinase [Clostridia bacterium]|nr:Stk1 family PASTA domain-containing Ser/Thr kinase [Clostridia bacterium]